MSRSTRKRVKDLERILTQVIDLTRNRFSISRFARDPEELLRLVQETGHPLVLEKDCRVRAIVADPMTFHKVERERRALASVLKGEKVFSSLEEIPRPTASRKSIGCETIVAIEACLLKIDRLERQIREDEALLDIWMTRIWRNKQDLIEARKERCRLMSRV